MDRNIRLNPLSEAEIRLILQRLEDQPEIVSAFTSSLELYHNPERDKYVALARERAREGELEVDDDAVVSVGGDPGAYVMCWLWIEDPDAEEDE